jgi:hypothetical protein
VPWYAYRKEREKRHLDFEPVTLIPADKKKSKVESMVLSCWGSCCWLLGALVLSTCSLSCVAQSQPFSPQAVTVEVLSCNETAVGFTYPDAEPLQTGYVLRCTAPFDGNGQCADASDFLQIFGIEDLQVGVTNGTHTRYQYRWFPGLIACEAYHWQVVVQVANNNLFSPPAFGIPYPTTQQHEPAAPTEPAILVAHQGTGAPGDPCVLVVLWTPPVTHDCALANCTVFYATNPGMTGELSISVPVPENHVLLTSGLSSSVTYYAQVACSNICGLQSPRSEQVSLFRDPACA